VGDVRDQVVSVRLTTDERDRLAALGSPSEVVRRWLRAAYADPPPFGETVGAEIPDTVWFDGTAGRTWPALETQ
jgi:hypothetical protein